MSTESVSKYNGLKFKYINLNELRDETIYRQLKEDTQREYLLAIFLFNIVNVFMKYYYNELKIDKPALEVEIREFKTFFERQPEDKIKEINEKRINRNNDYPLIYLARTGLNLIHSMFYNIFDLYDDTFNSRIILGKLCGIELTPDQFNSIILHFFDKIFYLRDILEPYYNSRSIIIKNYFPPNELHTPRGDILPLRNSKSEEYEIERGGATVTYDFNQQFKLDVLSENWNDGYDFYWKETDEYQDKRDKRKCERHFVEILTPDDAEIISMMVIRIPTISNKQIHFYIKKNLSTQIKLFLKNVESYKNISLLIHSFASSLFETQTVYSNLMHSMKKIFKENGIEPTKTYELTSPDEIEELARFCIRAIDDIIIITEDFRNLWKKDYSVITLSDTNNVKIFQLKSIATQNKYYNSIKKYLKYKSKYLELKNKLNVL